MSSGNFETGKYEAIGGTLIWPCRAQPETKELTISSVTNSYPAGAVTAGLPKVKLTKGNREFGPTIRKVTIELTADGTGQYVDYKSGNQYRLVTFTEAFHDSLVPEATGTYLGIACKVVDKFPQ